MNITESSEDRTPLKKQPQADDKCSTNLTNSNKNAKSSDDDEDFNNWLAVTEKPKVDNFQKNLDLLNKTPMKNMNHQVVRVDQPLPKSSSWLIADASLLTSAADVVKNLRKIWDQEKIVLQSSIHCDFVVSQRFAVIRLKWSELSSPVYRQKVVESYAKANCLYLEIVVLVLDDRETNLIRGRTKNFDTILAYLSKTSTILFSKAKSKL